MTDAAFQRALLDAQRGEPLARVVSQIERAGIDPVALARELLRDAGMPSRVLVEALCAASPMNIVHIAAGPEPGDAYSMLCGAESADDFALHHAGRAVATCVRCLQLDGRCACGVYHEARRCVEVVDVDPSVLGTPMLQRCEYVGTIDGFRREQCARVVRDAGTRLCDLHRPDGLAELISPEAIALAEPVGPTCVYDDGAGIFCRQPSDVLVGSALCRAHVDVAAGRLSHYTCPGCRHARTDHRPGAGCLIGWGGPDTGHGCACPREWS